MSGKRKVNESGVDSLTTEAKTFATIAVEVNCSYRQCGRPRWGVARYRHRRCLAPAASAYLNFA